jgi:zinc transport system substrate-binding protein
MKKILLSGLFLGTLILGGAGCAQKINSNEPVVATTIVPLTSVTKNILGDVADVQSVLPKGAEPHDVILSTRELEILQRTKAIVTLGLTLDDWIANGISAAESKAPVITASKFLNLPPGADDPHVWLSPARMIVMVQGIGAEMQKQFPESSEIIGLRTSAYVEKLRALDAEYRTLGALPERNIVTLHDAFGYLAQDYNLNVVAVVKDIPEDNPSPAEIAAVIRTLEKYPQAALFGESELSPAILESVARDTGRTIYILNPLEVAEPEPETYISVMTQNLATLKEALGGAKK